jgi:hypothetical protein
VPGYHWTTDIRSVRSSLPSATDGIQLTRGMRVQVQGMMRRADYKRMAGRSGRRSGQGNRENPSNPIIKASHFRVNFV